MIGGDLPELYDVWWANRRKTILTEDGYQHVPDPELTVRGVSKDVAEQERARLQREADEAGYTVDDEPYVFEVRPHDPHQAFGGGIYGE